MSSEDADGSVQVEEPRQKRQLPLWLESILLLCLALGLAVLIKALLVQAFYIPSESMEPGLVNNDRILVQKVSYWFGGTPQRGDVVVFKDPGDWLPAEGASGAAGRITSLMAKVGLYPSGGHLVKRVIGIAGDRIHCCDSKGRIEVNGVSLKEKSYARKGGATCYGPMVHNCSEDWDAGPVPEGSIFVMGDNRNDSADSSFHLRGPAGDAYVAVDLVVGKVLVVLWPQGHFRWLHRPADFADVPDATAGTKSRRPSSG